MDKEGIWLDREFAKERKLKVVDKIKVSMNGYTLDETIQGLIISGICTNYCSDTSGRVVIYNLGVLLESQRELSTLKVIGFKTKKLRILLLTQNIWLTVIGIIIGIPIGLWMTRYIFRFVGKVFDLITIASLSSFVYAVVGTMLISIIVNRLFSSRLKKIDMVCSLKGVE